MKEEVFGIIFLSEELYQYLPVIFQCSDSDLSILCMNLIHLASITYLRFIMFSPPLSRCKHMICLFINGCFLFQKSPIKEYLFFLDYIFGMPFISNS